MTYFNRDKERSVLKTVSFCGKGVLTTNDNEAIKSGCYLQENNEDGLDVEACFCNDDWCNGSIVTTQVNQILLIIIIVSNTLMMMAQHIF